MAAFPAVKDVDAVLDFQLDWSDDLPTGDTIDVSTWTADDGISIVSNTKTALTTTVWLSGGTKGHAYDVKNHIVSAAGREDDRTIKVTVYEA